MVLFIYSLCSVGCSMSYLALYRKYRPSRFEEFVGQNYIVDVLKRSLENNKISHAYLFFGPRGTGKTSMAKLIAKLVNCENRDGVLACDDCKSCNLINSKSNPDIIEMDAASNNGVDEIREIRNKISLLPSVSKYKVYIIDEVHMLSSGAFNALLKTLEEPPKHVIFILATTEFYKVPETIVSRCQCFEFTKVSEKDIVERLKAIVKAEKIDIDPEVLPLIAKYSDGGMRDSISFLDKLNCYSDKIKKEDFYLLKGIVNEEDLLELVKKIYCGDLGKTFEIYNKFLESGKSITILINDLVRVVKDLIVKELREDSNEFDRDVLYRYIDILNEYSLKIKNLSNSNSLFEVCLLKMIKDTEIISREIIFEKKCVDNTKNGSKEAEIVNIEQAESKKDVNNVENNVKEKEIEIEHKGRNIIINNAFATADKHLLEKLKLLWTKLNDYLFNKEFGNVVSYLLDGTLRVAGKGDVIISVMDDSFVNNAYENLSKLSSLFAIMSGDSYNLSFITDEEWKKLKNKYVSDIKNGKKYEYIDYKDMKSDIINKDDSQKDYSDAVNDAKMLFGDELVEIK